MPAGRGDGPPPPTPPGELHGGGQPLEDEAANGSVDCAARCRGRPGRPATRAIELLGQRPVESERLPGGRHHVGWGSLETISKTGSPDPSRARTRPGIPRGRRSRSVRGGEGRTEAPQASAYASRAQITLSARIRKRFTFFQTPINSSSCQREIHTASSCSPLSASWPARGAAWGRTSIVFLDRLEEIARGVEVPERREVRLEALDHVRGVPGRVDERVVERRPSTGRRPPACCTRPLEVWILLFTPTLSQ